MLSEVVVYSHAVDKGQGSRGAGEQGGRGDGEDGEDGGDGGRGVEVQRDKGEKFILQYSCLSLTTNHRLQALPPCDGGKQLLQAPLTTSS